ncbi:hypothetical protein BAUCODRAFT_158901 [Baudoinia panamericana UAMH 10762]|uniref:Endoplasmic reticulum lectin n=1 Tax=Baudoinia panamericana (strain UAMH 10762) TaxID=717646 RepID=M2N2D4_BAUPA|nr:uncharacterized protein BAUCODRAFT_158901 [Baudoinia panamericana UAMH 10762]EMC93144.1 hypothetical protein BAUCODRAFT_158901 [Baudoinia panamericana UAMH 10762]
MKHLLALPAILRASLYLASASFSVNEDLLAFPQFEVKFTDSYLSELQAETRLHGNEQIKVNEQPVNDDGLQEPPPSQVQQYQGERGDGKIKEEPRLGYEYMVLDGQRYLCSVPEIKPSAFASGVPGANDTLSKVEEEKELARAKDRGWELLSAMQGNCVYFISGWWSYRFCYGQGVKQFHQLSPNRGVPVYPPVEDPTVEGFELGNYKPPEKGESDDWAPQKTATGEQSETGSALDTTDGAAVKHRYSGTGELVQRGESRYLVQRLSGGTTCDLTGKDRRIEVQFHCNPQSADRISLIKETATCAYLMVIQTPRLCNDVAFLPPQKDQPNAISCSPILGDDQVEDYERDLKAIKSAETENKLWEAGAEAAAAMGVPGYEQSAQLVGDIIVGGHALVPEGVKIEKSAIVGGGKETYIDTVASSDGRILSEEDMKRLGLGDPRAVEKLKKELEKIAQGQQWKLDVIDTPRGREYRGIIGDDDDEKEEEKKKAAASKKSKPSKDGDEKAAEGSEEEYYKEEL